MSTRDNLVRDVKQFLSIAGSPGTIDRISPTLLGLKISNSPNFVPRLYSGHDVTTATYDRAIDFMEKWYEEHGLYEDESNYAQADTSAYLRTVGILAQCFQCGGLNKEIKWQELKKIDMTDGLRG